MLKFIFGCILFKYYFKVFFFFVMVAFTSLGKLKLHNLVLDAKN
jgi:hypothetical protein